MGQSHKLEEMETERQRLAEERRVNSEEQASQAAIHVMRDEDRITRVANEAIVAQPAELIKVERT